MCCTSVTRSASLHTHHKQGQDSQHWACTTSSALSRNHQLVLFLQVEQQYSDDEPQDLQAQQTSESQAQASNAAMTQHETHSPSAAESLHIASEEPVSIATRQFDGEDSIAEQQNQAETSAQPDAETEDGVDEAYVMAYLGRHCCSQPMAASQEGQDAMCGGTMTPVGIHGDVYACNMCSHERLESERVAELERAHEEVAAKEGNELQ